jgi:radical SAM superfamily enzyme YgiQ (UPF0313 family)
MMDNGKVLFIIHDLYQEDNHFPLGVAYLAAVLKAKDVDVSVYNQDIYHYSNVDLAKFLKQNSFSLICVGFLAARFKETIIGLCDVINANKNDAWLVLGGHGPSPIPEYVLKETLSDVVVIGEGEETIIELLHCKLNNGNLSNIKGIAYRTGNDICINERRKPIIKIDNIPFPEWSVFPMQDYIRLKLFRQLPGDKSLNIITSRGCINKCNFCYRMENGIRFRSIKNVVNEISTLKERFDINYFLMFDELFAYPKKRVFEFKDELERNELKIKFVCNTRVDVFDEEVAEALKDAGCQFLNFGMESSDQTVLDKMNKNTTVEENIRAAEIAKKVGVGLGLNFIWGNIGDSKESLENNVRLIKKYNTYDQIRTIRPVTPYPGCDLYYEAIRRGLFAGPNDFFDKFRNSDLITVNFTTMSNKDMYKLLFQANRELILDYYNHTTKDMEAANASIKNFYDLYFMDKTEFRGARHYNLNRQNK